MAPKLDPMVGRYLLTEIEGVPHRLYFEEAGQGIPLVCLHTAGADGRQFRHLLADPEITSRFRVLAFDMPWHGKSTPPDGWEKTEYRLTTQSYTAAIRAFCAAMELDRPVVMGCSIGGRIVLNLAIEHASEFRALIALEAADFQQPWYTAWLHRPDVHGGPGVFKGDLYFYRVDGDLREKVKGIDTQACPLYLLTGEYDFSCTAEDTRRTAAQIPGAHVQIMKEVGHFPMSENPAKFREYILPILAEIK